MSASYRLVSSADQRLLDRLYTEESGLPSLVLMENAGRTLAETVLSLDLPEGIYSYDCLIFAGKGQNGGDGYAAARHLQSSGMKAAVVDPDGGSNLKADAAINAGAWRALGGDIISDLNAVPVHSVAVVVDAVFGSGFISGRPLEKSVKQMFSLMSQLQHSGSLVVACDLPSGLCADTGKSIDLTVPADITVTFGRPKIGLINHPGSLYAGEICTDNLGMSDNFVEGHLTSDPVYLLDSTLAASLDIMPAEDAHKGDNGRALLIGGSDNMPGSMLLAIEASSRSGAGYTMVRAPKELIPLLAQRFPSALYSSIPEGGVRKHDLPGPIDAVAIGMGASDATWVAKALSSLIPNERRLLIDADGLNVLAKMQDIRQLTDKRQENGMEAMVLTPHPGEFRRLAPELSDLLEQDRVSAARALSQKFASIVVLKGMSTVIAFPDKTVYINESGNAAMAKAGSGDVLSGMIVSNMAFMKDSYKAVLLSVYLHGLAGDLALAEHGDLHGLMAEDIIAHLSSSRMALAADS